MSISLSSARHGSLFFSHRSNVLPFAMPRLFFTASETAYELQIAEPLLSLLPVSECSSHKDIVSYPKPIFTLPSSSSVWDNANDSTTTVSSITLDK